MKLSFYNYEENNGESYILYNCRTDELLFLNESLKKIWIENSTKQLDRIGEIYPDFFQYLRDKGFIVDDSVDEQAEFLSTLQKEDTNEDYFSIIVNPTLDCNMRCWYCYEKHLSDSYMNNDIMERVLNLAKKKISNPKLKTFAISFFGGEPLLSFEDCVFPLLQEVDRLCTCEKKQLVVSFTSNAFLLSDDMVCKLKSLRLARPVDWQITIDGGRVLHNKTRHTIDKQDTYDIIVNNILRLLAAGMSVMVRFNYQSKSVLSFLDVIDSFRDYAKIYEDKLVFCFQQIWQDVVRCENAQIHDETLNNVKKSFKEAGLRVAGNMESPTRCYADNTNSIVINYNGNIFKCTAMDFKERNREGVLDAEGNVHYSVKFHDRMKARYANKTCLSCIIYPLCYGGCSQKLLHNSDKCSRDLNKEGITEFIRQRILLLAGHK